MSNLNRVMLLLEFLEEDPNNPFNVYALALEYQNIDPEKATYYFDQLLKSHQDYLPTYFQAALFFADQENVEKARGIYQAGIALAQKDQDRHTLKELENAYQNFLFENE